MALKRCINNKNETPKTAEEINSIQAAGLILVNLAKKTENSSIKLTIASCPSSMPKLNESKGNRIDSSFPNRDFSK